MNLQGVGVFWTCCFELQLEIQVGKLSRQLNIRYMALENRGVKQKYKYESILGQIPQKISLKQKHMFLDFTGE